MPRSIPSVRDNDPLLGKRISDAIAEQMKIVRAKYPKAQFVTDLWQEGARLMQKGYLKIPPEVTLVWADTGYGDMQDGGKVAAGQGCLFPRRDDERQCEPAFRDGAGRGDSGGTGPVHQGRRYFLLSREHERHSARRDDDASADGYCMGRRAGGGLAGGERTFIGNGPRRSLGRSRRMRLPACTRSILRRHRCGADCRRRADVGGKCASASTSAAQQRSSAMKAISIITPRCAVLFSIGSANTRSRRFPASRRSGRRRGCCLRSSEETEEGLLERDIEECEDAQPRWDAVWHHAVRRRAG